MTSRLRALLERLGRESIYLLLSWPVLLGAFIVLVTLVVTGAGLLLVWVGIPILALALALARWVAQAERIVQHRLLGRPPFGGVYRAAAAGESRWSALRRMATDPQHGMDLLFGLIAWVVSTATWSAAVVIWSVAIAGLGSPVVALFQWLMWPESPYGPYPTEVVLGFAVGLCTTLLLPLVIHGLTCVQTQLFAAILGWTGVQQQVDDLRTSRAAAQDAEAGALRKLERDLHDGPQQRLVRIQMDLGRALHKLPDDPATARTAVESSLAQTRATLDELRLLSRGIASPILLDRGIAAALDDLVARSALPARLTSNLAGRRVPERVQNAAYYLVSESLTNAAKHSGASRVDVDARLSEGMLRITVRDDGCGGATFAAGSGLPGLRDRVRGLDGRLDVDSPPGGPTVLAALLPVTD